MAAMGRQAGHASRSLRTAAGWAVVGLLVLLAVVVFRIGSELHYSGCVDASRVRYAGATDKLSNFARAGEVHNCTRSPFVHTGQGP
jgi:hypothetical protein